MRISLPLLKGTEILVRSFEKFRIARKNPPSGKLTLGLQKRQTLNKNMWAICIYLGAADESEEKSNDKGLERERTFYQERHWEIN